MTVLGHDLEQLIAERAALGHDHHDEVWDGVYFMSPSPNLEHQLITGILTGALLDVTSRERGDAVVPGVNVSDREAGWRHNYRVPDLAVILAGNPGKNCETHWCGGPDLVVEVVSRGDRAREKLPFYASVGVRELLVVDRGPWVLELYRLVGGVLEPSGRSQPGSPEVLRSAVVPLTFRLAEGRNRPVIEVVTTDGRRTWTA